ncbi:MAG: hypothetical protein ACOY45_07785 [Pseudomonadota bacterium]
MLTLWIAAMMLSPSLSMGSTFVTVEKTCPVGGEKFKFSELASISVWGSMADGMPIGSGAFPIALPICPTNGLVMYRDFTRNEAKRLAPIVAGADYAAMRRVETPYYRAYRLADALGDAAGNTLGLLLAASWEAKNAGQIDLAARYTAEFVARVTALPDAVDPVEAVALNARAVNGLRELGRFDEAEAMRVSLYARVDALKDAEARDGWRSFLGTIKAPIARHDAARAPIDLMEEQGAAMRCLSPEFPAGDQPVAPLTDFEQAFCARPELKPIVEKMRERMS